MKVIRPVGRPRDQTVRESLLRAAFSVLAEAGWSGFTLEAVAAESGAARTTIYRWWGSKYDLALEAFSTERTLEVGPPPRSAFAEDEFRARIVDLAAALRGARGRVFAALVGAARTDRTLERALSNARLDPWTGWELDRMCRAADEGQLNDGVRPEAALELLYGPIFSALLFGREVPTQREISASLALSCAVVFRRARETA